MHNIYPPEAYSDKTRAKNSAGGFAARLRELREKLGLSQEILGKMIGVSVTTIQNYESGQYPRGEVAVRLSKALSCSLDWLLCGTELSREPDTQPAQSKRVQPHSKMRMLTLNYFRQKNEFHYATVAINLAMPPEYAGRDIFAVLISDTAGHLPFKQGQVLYFERNQEPDPGDTVFLEKNNQTVLLKKFIDKSEGCLLVSDLDKSDDNAVTNSAATEKISPINLVQIASLVQVKLKP